MEADETPYFFTIPRLPADQKGPSEAKDGPGQSSAGAESQMIGPSPGRGFWLPHGKCPRSLRPSAPRSWKEVCPRLHSEDRHCKKALVTWDARAQL